MTLRASTPPGRRRFAIAALLLLSTACRSTPPVVLTVAAAANLTDVFDTIGKAFTRKTAIPVTFSYASTAQLTQQINNGAPFDVFAAADTEHIDQLVRGGKLVPETRLIYAIGRLVLWVPPNSKAPIQKLEDLTGPEVRFISIAQPDAAPYGAAAVETLKRLGIWEKTQPKVVYASNISMSKQFAATGNADAAFTAYSLVLTDQGRVVQVDEKLHAPINQALGILSTSQRREQAGQFVAFLSTGEGRALLEKFGYVVP